MVTIKVYNDIITDSDVFLYEMFGEENTLSLGKVKDIFNKNPNENDFKFDIHCNGGYVSEGLAIYDTIRTSGKNIYCDINGSCHSMAVCLLLAAPFENRTANPHAQALIHKVRGGCIGVTAEEAQQYAADVKKDENAIIDIYVDRTGKSKEAMKALMSAEKIRTADELLQLGFISKINSYNTNFKNFSKMEKNDKKDDLLKRAGNFVTKAVNWLSQKTANFDYADAEGNVLFSTESEEDTLAVGDVVTIPDGATGGTFTLEDGRVVTIADNVVTEIGEAAPTEDLQAENDELRNQLQEAVNLINELKSQVASNYKPATRTTAQKGATPTSNVADKLAAAKAARDAKNGKK
jgi:ATP-dependent Clp protease protease subunit